MSLIRTFTDVITAPRTAVETIRHRGRAWLPIVAKALAIVALWLWYFHAIDLEWFKDEVVFQGQQVPPEARAAIDELMTRQLLTVGAIVSDLIMVAVILVSMTAYLWVVGRDNRGKRPPFRQWLALVAWSSAPTFLVTIATVLIVLARGGEVLPTELDPTTLNTLIIGAAPTSKWALWATSFSLVHVWSLGIMSLAFRQWTGRSWSTSIAFVTAPAVFACVMWAAWIAS